MAVTYEEKLTYLRSWAKGRARYASEPEGLHTIAAEDVMAEVGPPDEAPTPGTKLFRSDADAEW